ncbi:TRAP transporter large permease [Spirabiliibacterium falconis]|uniref:TRAP transporter large permease n=1 Tax=Spirabiliibacterium falconis TaxID=572023 RepID=UPI001AAE0178|nr:TRAP transporter large permease [Spirabiliibacterium falconis]MBE2894892.1 TRAP transporter large permease [Spirabiliibacterium falconis]
MTAEILFGSFLLLLLIGVPIGIALGSASIIAILFMPFLNFQFFVQGLISSLDSFTLLAVILFTLAGNLMSHGGISERLLHVAKAFFGHYTGGLGIVTIIACVFFSAISGTGSATVAAIGLSMIPAMAKSGYDRAYAASMVATAGGIGVIIPPSVVMIVYAIIAGESVTAMFMAGIIPGLVVALVLLAYSIYQSYNKGYSGHLTKFSWKEKIQALNKAKASLLLPVIILGGIYSGQFTPTESAAVAVIYGGILSFFIYKELNLSDLPKIILESAILVSTVLVIVGASVAFGRILTIDRVPEQIATFILSLTDNKIFILLAINILLLIVGTFLETLAAVVILTPILLPIVTTLGISPVHFGIIMVVNLAIGFITPPLGANLFMASQVGNVAFSELSKSILGWLGAMLIALLLITYIPQLSLFLPSLFQ